MFFHRQNVEGDSEPFELEDETGPAIIDGKGLFTKLPDDESLPVGQLYLEVPMGLVDYNKVIDNRVERAKANMEKMEAGSA